MDPACFRADLAKAAVPGRCALDQMVRQALRHTGERPDKLGAEAINSDRNALEARRFDPFGEGFMGDGRVCPLARDARPGWTGA